MANDVQSLFGESACYVCAGVSGAQALELVLLARIVNGGGLSPGGDRITEESDPRITEGGETRVIE